VVLLGRFVNVSLRSFRSVRAVSIADFAPPTTPVSALTARVLSTKATSSADMWFRALYPAWLSQFDSLTKSCASVTLTGGVTFSALRTSRSSVSPVAASFSTSPSRRMPSRFAADSSWNGRIILGSMPASGR
jgi:hypothetical protein